MGERQAHFNYMGSSPRVVGAARLGVTQGAEERVGFVQERTSEEGQEVVVGGE